MQKNRQQSNTVVRRMPTANSACRPPRVPFACRIAELSSAPQSRPDGRARPFCAAALLSSSCASCVRPLTSKNRGDSGSQRQPARKTNSDGKDAQAKNTRQPDVTSTEDPSMVTKMAPSVKNTDWYNTCFPLYDIKEKYVGVIKLGLQSELRWSASADQTCPLLAAFLYTR